MGIIGGIVAHGTGNREEPPPPGQMETIFQLSGEVHAKIFRRTWLRTCQQILDSIGSPPWSIGNPQTHMTKDLQPISSDEYDRKTFWFTWPGVILGSIGIVGFVLLYVLGNSIVIENRTEPGEIKDQLIKAKYFDQHFEFISEISPVGNPPKGKGAKRVPNWEVAKRGVKSIGYFTIKVVGWVKLADRRQSSIEAVVFFEQVDGNPLTITCVEDQFMHRPYPPPESLEVIELLRSYFEYSTQIEPVGNFPSCKEDVSAKKIFNSSKLNWFIETADSKTTGFFTYNVRGWIKLADKEPINDRIVVSFEKTAGHSVRITKIEGRYPYQIQKLKTGIQGENP
ncbi:MAG: hypothetical protein IPP19_11925 [Verrucomicrobia bacterium]|nr:hypothetical protein [Verrucomicrobiota bacterium]